MKSTITILILIIALLAVALPANAQVWDGVNCNQQGEGPCNTCDALKVSSNVIKLLTQFAISLSALMVAYGAILMMLSGSNEGLYSKGKKAIIWAVIGVVVALGGWIIVNTIINILAPDTSFLPWSEIQCTSTS